MKKNDDRATWHELIQAGNAQFAAGRLSDALGTYDRALDMVDRLLACGRVDVALLISKIVTHHNRAETLVRLQRYPDADTAFRHGHAFAQAIVEEAAFPENLRQAARCHCRIMFSEWRMFRSAHGHGLDDAEPFFAARSDHAGPGVTATVH